MTALLEYQATLAAAVRGGDRRLALALFRGTAERRDRAFNVYANNAMHALVSALSATFPVVQRILGEPGFTSVAIGYARQHPPPRDALLIWYGREFPRFLESLEVAGAPYLADLARLEFAWLEAYHAAEAEPLPAAHFATLIPEQLVAARLSPHPSVRLLRSSWAIDRIWRSDPGIAAGGDRPAEDGAGACCLIVARPFAEVRVLPVSSPVFDCLGELCEGTLFGDAIDHLDQAEAVAELQALIAAGLFAAVDIQA
jgi:hypothetical protein